MTSIIVDIRDGKFPSLRIPPGTLVAWRNLDPTPHSAETLRSGVSFSFSAGAMHPGQTSAFIEFAREGCYPYLCRFHHGMTGEVVVADGPIEVGSASGGGHGHHFKHFHGFVTGGRSASRLFLSHTPVIADNRHHFQIILKASLVDRGDIEAYENLRNSEYADGVVQTFHGHLSLPDIRDGKIQELPHSSLVYYPGGKDGILVPGTAENSVRVKIDEVLFFHTFEKDAPYPNGLEYLVYGDEEDVFIDHAIDRAPGFHSVAKLAFAPAFWKGKDVVRIKIPSKRIRDVQPQILDRGAIVDNAFHIFWLPPSGLLRPEPKDPLETRDESPAVYDCVLEDGTADRIEVGRFLHFDVKLLNYGVLIAQ